MKTIIYSLIWVLVLFACQSNPTYDTAITNVTIIDIETGDLLEDQNLLILGNRLTIKPASQSIKALQTINGDGMFVTPGLYEMHAHTLYGKWPRKDDGPVYPSRELMNLKLAAGITGFRDMYGEMQVANEVREEAAAGQILTPRFTITSHLLANNSFMGATKILDSADVDLAIDSLAGSGVDYIKIFSMFSPEMLDYVMEKANQANLSVIGHVPRNMSAFEASEKGMKSLEHLMGIMADCSENAEAFYALLDTTRMTGPLIMGNHPLLTVLDETRCDSLARVLAENETWVVPTVVLADSKVRIFTDSATLWEDEYMTNYSGADMDYMHKMVGYYHKYFSEEDVEVLEKMRANRLKVIKILSDNEVGIMAGSDFPNALATSGYGLYQEVALFREAGLSPLEALQTCTLNPIIYLNQTDSLGYIKDGYIADFTVFTKNPLNDLDIHAVEMVGLNGQVLQRPALDSLQDYSRKRLREVYTEPYNF